MEMNKEKGYYDVEIDFNAVMSNTADLDNIFYLQDLQQRKMFINEDIDAFSVQDVVKHIMQYNKEDKGVPVADRKPILLYITSNGGEVDAGFRLIDIIEASRTPVYTVNLSNQYSMGFLIGLAGHKRFATKNAKFLMHDGSNFVYNSGAKAQDQMEFNRKIEQRVKNYVLSKSKINEDVYDSKLRVEWYMFADEAKENGMTDFIIGEDCDIEAII